MPLLVVEGDPVEGTDTHNAAGQATDTSTGLSVPWTGTGKYAYAGSMTDGLSEFVRIGGAAVALASSVSTLDEGQDVAPEGGHSGPAGSALTAAEEQPPTALVPVTATVMITDTVGEGTPSETAGSAFVSAGGSPVLLDGDSIDSCDGTGATGNSSVTASTQDFVTASG